MDEDFATVATGPARIERRRLGRVDLPDGRVFACDPLVPADQAPFAQQVPPGTYEVVLFVAVSHGAADRDRGAEINTAGALVFSPTPPVTWRRAPRAHGDPHGGAYGVDSGTGCLMGNLAAQSLFGGGPEASDHATTIMMALDKTQGAIVTLPSGSIAAFRTGEGDGVYDSWWGYDKAGAAVIVVTNFDTLRSTAEVSEIHNEWASRRKKSWWQFWK